jgi:hypothetical protein
MPHVAPAAAAVGEIGSVHGADADVAGVAAAVVVLPAVVDAALDPADPAVIDVAPAAAAGQLVTAPVSAQLAAELLLLLLL